MLWCSKDSKRHGCEESNGRFITWKNRRKANFCCSVTSFRFQNPNARSHAAGEDSPIIPPWERGETEPLADSDGRWSSKRSLHLAQSPPKLACWGCHPPRPHHPPEDLLQVPVPWWVEVVSIKFRRSSSNSCLPFLEMFKWSLSLRPKQIHLGNQWTKHPNTFKQRQFSCCEWQNP